MFLPRGFKDPVWLLEKIKKEPEVYWIRRGERRVLQLFHAMAERVPAYKDFLRKNKINQLTIKTITDFKKVPLISKENYLKKYDLARLCWDGKLKNGGSWTISSTSGSTGEPFYFPRQEAQDWQYAVVAEMYLRENYQIHKQSTLYIDAFPMGPWIGGVFTYQAIRMVAARGDYDLSIITTGIDKDEIIKAVLKFGKLFDQIIIGCYAPFLKDAIDEGIGRGVKWRKYKLGFIFSAEGFSETFRDYIVAKTGLTRPYRDTLNHYGTVDLGTMAHETPLSIMLRRVAVKKKNFYRALFGDIYKLPTFCQYIPELFYFEDLAGNLVCSGYSGLPLARYDLKDHGGVITLEEVMNRCHESGINFMELTKEKGIDNAIWQLPFVFVYERSDFSVSLYSFQIYSETVRKALQHVSLHKSVTGKFVMMVKYNEQQNQYLEINVELMPGVKESKKLEDMIVKLVVEFLLRENSEYAETFKTRSNRIIPKIVFWPHGDPEHFRPGIKQKWVKK